MITVFSPEYPSLRVQRLGVTFEGGRADVSKDIAERLREIGPRFGLVFADLAEDPETEAESDEPAPVDEAADNGMPSARATVKEWVTYMAEQGIEHPEDATKAEMRVIAEAHFKEA